MKDDMSVSLFDSVNSAIILWYENDDKNNTNNNYDFSF